MAEQEHSMDFDALVSTIQEVHRHLAAQAGKAVNISLTLRNWAIGAYIAEYELRGADRAAYGEMLLHKLSERLRSNSMNRVSDRDLRRYRQFYLVYPQIRQSVTPEFERVLPVSPTAPNQKVRSVTTQSGITPQKLLNHLSYTHFEQLLAIDDPPKRAFYEVECMAGNWSVRELKRQIGSLYYERSGLSKNKQKLAEIARSDTEQTSLALTIRDPYVFEFLGLKSKEVMSESDLEDALLDKLQDFLLELGHGFCFEARQRRILIGETYGFVDLVFYHRILKCHVLLDLKVEHFSHENIGQLNTYVSWYRANMMTDGDNPPVGILLCTQKDHALVEYALAGMDNKLFVSKYQLALPNKEEIQRFLEDNIRRANEATDL